jgi:hypothetical protein
MYSASTATPILLHAIAYAILAILKDEYGKVALWLFHTN